MLLRTSYFNPEIWCTCAGIEDMKLGLALGLVLALDSYGRSHSKQCV